MLSNYLTNEIKGCLKKIDDLDFHFEKYKEHETKCKELKKTLDALERRCERYKRYCEEMESHSQGDIEAFYQDFRNLNCKVSEFTCDYENLKQVTEKLDFKNFAFLIDTEKTKEIADQCWEAGYAIIESDEKLQLKFIVEENKLKQEVDINQEECRKDKQLIAEKILQELGKIKEGPKNKQIREDLELVGKLTNSSQLLKAAKEKYCTLEEIFNQSNEVFNSTQERVYQLNEDFFALSDEIKKTRSSDGIMEPIVQDPEKTREILEKILTEKEKRKEKGPLDVKREQVKEPKTLIEKIEEKNNKKKEVFSKISLKRGEACAFKDKNVLEIYQKCSPVAWESKLIVEHLKDLLKLKEEIFKKEYKGIPDKEIKPRLDSIVQNKKRLAELEKTVDSNVAYMNSTIVESNIQDRSNKCFLETKIKYHTQSKKQEISIIAEDELYKKLENNLSLLQCYKKELENWISEEEEKQVTFAIQNNDKRIRKVVDPEWFARELEEMNKLRETREKLQRDFMGLLSIVQNSESTTPNSNFSELDEICRVFESLTRASK